MEASPQILLIIASASLFLAIFAAVSSIVLSIKLSKIGKNLKTLFSGKQASDLESIILAQTKEIMALDKEIQELFEISNKLHGLGQKSLHKFAVVRFNPFKDLGGDQSFALALLDGKNSGLVISSLHTREGTRIYSKPVVKGESEKYTLTEEEKQAIAGAIAQKPTKV